MLSAHLQALALLIAANATPVVVAKLMRERAGVPLDFGMRLPDGERLFGDHKTWRGLVFGVAVTAIMSRVLGLSVWIGVGFAATSLLGDALSSAVKRRMHLKPGAEMPGFDQIGEAVLPLVVFSSVLSLQPWGIAVVTAVFAFFDLALTRLRHAPWLDPSR